MVSVVVPRPRSTRISVSASAAALLWRFGWVWGPNVMPIVVEVFVKTAAVSANVCVPLQPVLLKVVSAAQGANRCWNSDSRKQRDSGSSSKRHLANTVSESDVKPRFSGQRGGAGCVGLATAAAAVSKVLTVKAKHETTQTITTAFPDDVLVGAWRIRILEERAEERGC